MLVMLRSGDLRFFNFGLTAQVWRTELRVFYLSNIIFFAKEKDPACNLYK